MKFLFVIYLCIVNFPKHYCFLVYFTHPLSPSLSPLIISLSLSLLNTRIMNYKIQNMCRHDRKNILLVYAILKLFWAFEFYYSITIDKVVLYFNVFVIILEDSCRLQLMTHFFLHIAYLQIETQQTISCTSGSHEKKVPVRFSNGNLMIYTLIIRLPNRTMRNIHLCSLSLRLPER